MTSASTPCLIERAMARSHQETRHAPSGNSPPNHRASSDEPSGTPSVRTFKLQQTELVRLGLLATSSIPHLSEQIAAIERSLSRRLDLFLKIPGERRKHRVLITSPRQGEGKSFIAWNLAIDLASNEGIGVVLIDADLRSVGWSSIIGRSAVNGLVDLLADRASPSTCLYRAENMPITVLPGGQRTLTSGKMFEAKKFSKLVDYLSKQYSDDLIIIDGPPALTGIEINTLASNVDETVIVVSSGNNSASDLEDTVSLFDDDNKLSFVINRC